MWRREHGGLLRMYGLPSKNQNNMKDVEPRADRLVLFDSRLEHEVLPLHPKRRAGSQRASYPRRCAFTQWFSDTTDITETFNIDLSI